MSKFLPTIGEMSGKLGSLVYSHNKGGYYVRLKGSPTNPNSTRQQESRGWLAQLSAAWAGLTDEQRSAWDSWAQENPLTDPLGQSYFRTGHQCFVGLNTRLLDAGLTQTNTPPAQGVPVTLTTFTVTFNSTTQINVAFAPALPSGNCLYVWMSNPQEGQGDPNLRQAVLVGYSAADAASPVTLELPKSCQTGTTTNFWGGILDDVGQVGVAQKDREVKS